MIFSIVNHKGGTGKTTTTINLGSALALQGFKIALVDFDAQGSLSYSLGIDDNNLTVADALYGDARIQELVQVREGMHVIPANATLADAELSIAKAGHHFGHLKTILSQLLSYDFILIDCPPSLSLLTLNALAASDHVIIPMQMDVLSLRGLDSMIDTVKKIHEQNPRLSILGVLAVMADPRKNIHMEIMEHVKTNYPVRIFKQSIRSSVKAVEAPSFGKSVIGYAPTSTTARDFNDLAKEIIEIISNQSINNN